MRFFSLVLLLTAFLSGAAFVKVAQAQVPVGAQIAFSAFNKGQWDLFAISPDGEELRQLTDDAFEDSSPAYSPDGTKLAYSSRRNKNWDIYILDLASGEETRLTSHPDYDGSPAWHPNGNQIAFESYRVRDLDIWVADLSEEPLLANMTASSAAGEFTPTWHPDGTRLFFASWRAGDNDIWALDLETDGLLQLTNTPASDSQPIWDADIQRLIFARNILGAEDVFMTASVATEDVRYTWLGSLSWPVLSPDSMAIAGLYNTHEATHIVRLDKDSVVPQFLTPPAILRGAMSWHEAAVYSGTPISALASYDTSSLYTEDLTPSSSPNGEPYDLIRLDDLETGTPWLADTVDDSYTALRNLVREEVGYDYLGEVSETLRPINFFSDASQYSSWHKSGRAFDTVFDLPSGGMEIVKEEIGGETFWRIYLRCTNQNGRCGQPVTINPWDYSYEARNLINPEQGGIEKPNLYGYYIDFTRLAEMYGWQRIASYDDEDFSWTWHFKAFEYWHYQKKFEDDQGASNWYQAMRQVYPQFEVDEFFTWDQMRAADEDPYLIIFRGVPISPEAERWWHSLVP